MVETFQKPTKELFIEPVSKDDVTIQLKGGVLYAPEQFLCLISPVFGKMLTEGGNDGNLKSLSLTDTKREDMLAFLTCLHPSRLTPVTEVNVYRILPLADRYQVTGLLAICSQTLIQILGKCTMSIYKKQLYDNKPDMYNRDKVLKILQLVEYHKLHSVVYCGVECLAMAHSCYYMYNETFLNLDCEIRIRVLKAALAKYEQP